MRGSPRLVASANSLSLSIIADQNAIEALPASWAAEKEARDHPMEARRYTEALERLTSLGEERQQLRAHVERLRRLQAAVELLRVDEGGRGVQENLVTRNGEVERELERTRVLLARVAGRVGQLPDAADGDEGVSLDMRGARQRAVEEFLESSGVFPG
jgi:hypothetical protein